MNRYAEWPDQVLYHGRAEDTLNHFGSDSFDLIVTSPPYNLEVAYPGYEDRLPYDQYLHWMNEVFDTLQAVLTRGGSLFLNMGASPSQPWIALDVAQLARDYFVLQNQIIWVKSVSIGERTWGHSRPINSPRFLNHNFEHLFHFSTGGNAPLNRLAVGVPYQDKQNLTRGTRGQHGDVRCAGDVWFVPYATVQSRREKGGHPAIFPPELVERCLKLAGATPATRILDPFCGTGTVAVAARKLGLKSTGIDICATSLEYARERLRFSTPPADDPLITGRLVSVATARE